MAFLPLCNPDQPSADWMRAFSCHLTLQSSAPALKKPLPKCVSIGYTQAMSGKDAGLRIRVERELRQEFLEACRQEDRPAAQVLREFMRSYVARHADQERNKETEAPLVGGLVRR